MCTQQTEFYLYELPFKIRTRKTKLSPKSIVRDLYTVLITKCEDLHSQASETVGLLVTVGVFTCWAYWVFLFVCLFCA